VWKPREESEPKPIAHLIDRRGEPRFNIRVPIRVYSKTSGILVGDTADISESGLSAILPIEVAVGELVELEFTLPFGQVIIYAVVAQRNAFRYGFRFTESSYLKEVIRPTCRDLAIRGFLTEKLD
jgi:PilZ domain